MDEVDNIIIHNLRQIGCKIDDDVLSLSSFSPELLVETVSVCLQLIKPKMNLPRTLPQGMAQRFSVTASLADACTSIGFRGDIGYQTFLYSNVIEVRRVFMFLIERLPKESEKCALAQPLDKLSALENDLFRKIRSQTSSPWIPQYCIKSGIRIYNTSSLTLNTEGNAFQPYINLNIPISLRKSNIPSKQREYWLKRSPSIFHQTNSQTICPSIIHKNDIERESDGNKENYEELVKLIMSNNNSGIVSTLNSSSLIGSGTKNLLISSKTISTINSTSNNSVGEKFTLQGSAKEENSLDQWNNVKEELNSDVMKLKSVIDKSLLNRKNMLSDIANVKELRANQEQINNNLKNKRKINERTCILLQNPDENVKKMELVLAATRERMHKLIDQWEEYKEPLIKSLASSKSINTSNFDQNKIVQNEVKIVREKTAEIIDDLKNKNNLHAQLSAELQKVDNKISRNAYTTRILEIVGNIRKQKNDIDKVLKDTRELQKEINNINGQLDRQFTVTDDLLYKTARRDEDSKQTYKFLATLHSNCNDLVTLVQEIGAIMREIRDLEDQIENEKGRNISINLEKITSDLREMEKDSKFLQDKIRQVENEITQVSVDNKLI